MIPTNENRAVDSEVKLRAADTICDCMFHSFTKLHLRLFIAELQKFLDVLADRDDSVFIWEFPENLCKFFSLQLKTVTDAELQAALDDGWCFYDLPDKSGLITMFKPSANTNDTPSGSAHSESLLSRDS